jgi:hypothetical protein
MLLTVTGSRLIVVKVATARKESCDRASVFLFQQDALRRADETLLYASVRATFSNFFGWHVR